MKKPDRPPLAGGLFPLHSNDFNAGHLDAATPADELDPSSQFQRALTVLGVAHLVAPSSLILFVCFETCRVRFPGTMFAGTAAQGYFSARSTSPTQSDGE